MKTIIAFLGIILLWGSAPVFAIECGVGHYVYTDSSTGVQSCEDCSYGYYNDVAGTGHCKKCPTPYEETWVNDPYDPTRHDQETDCMIRVVFHSNGGYFRDKNNDFQHDYTAAAYYTSSSNYTANTQTCPVQISGTNKFVHLCTNKKDKFKISDPTSPKMWRKAGFEFAGWFKEEGLQNLVTANDEFDTYTQLYAKWCKTSDNLVPKNGDCVCKKGYTKHSDGTCKKCPESFTTAGAGGTKCVCELGFVKTVSEDGATTTCEKCPKGKTTYDYAVVTQCEPIKTFKYGTGSETWTWPNKVNPGELESSVKNN